MTEYPWNEKNNTLFTWLSSHYNPFNEAAQANIETLSKIFDFYIIWKALMRGFQNGLIFKIWPSSSGDILILVLQKMGFC